MITTGGDSLHIHKKLLLQDDGLAKKTIKIEVPEEGEWGVVHTMVRAFEAYYPKGMKAWAKNLKAQRREYNVGSGDLKKSNFRNTIAFPIMRKPGTDLDDCLESHISNVFPGIFKDKENRRYYEFMRRYPEFVVPEKI